MKSRMTEMVTFGSVRGTYNPEEVRNGFYLTVRFLAVSCKLCAVGDQGTVLDWAIQHQFQFF
jgi:hypothetical protein